MSTDRITNQSITASEDFLGLHEPFASAPTEPYSDVPEVLKALDNWVCLRHELLHGRESNYNPGTGKFESGVPLSVQGAAAKMMLTAV